MLLGQIEGHTLTAVSRLQLLPVAGRFPGQGGDLFLDAQDLVLGLQTQIGLGHLVDGLAHGLAVRGDGQVDHDLLGLVVEIGFHGVGEAGVETDAGHHLAVIAGHVVAVRIVIGQGIAHFHGHAGFGQILPDRIGQGQALDLQFHGAVDQQRRLLDGQEHAILEREFLGRVIEVGDHGLELALVLHRHTGHVFQPVLGGQFRGIGPGLLRSTSRKRHPGAQGRHSQSLFPANPSFRHGHSLAKNIRHRRLPAAGHPFQIPSGAMSAAPGRPHPRPGRHSAADVHRPSRDATGCARASWRRTAAPYPRNG